jgi:hypothetical protein
VAASSGKVPKRDEIPDFLEDTAGEFGNLTPQPPSHLSLALPYKGREKEKLF